MASFEQKREACEGLTWVPRMHLATQNCYSGPLTMIVDGCTAFIETAHQKDGVSISLDCNGLPDYRITVACSETNYLLTNKLVVYIECRQDVLFQAWS